MVPVPWIAVDNKSPILGFGIMSDGKRSSYWRVRAGVAKPELCMERESNGKEWHFSLHASGLSSRRDTRNTLDALSCRSSAGSDVATAGSPPNIASPCSKPIIGKTRRPALSIKLIATKVISTLTTSSRR
jgi:hypothetical protein